MWPSTLRAGGRAGRLLQWLPLVGIALACLAGKPARALDPSLHLHNYHHTTWTAEQGAPTIITTMAQTRDGWLWLGTASGLYRFDGVRFSKFASTDGSTPLGTGISNLYAMNNGDLLIGYLTGGLSVLRNDKLVHLRARKEIGASYQAQVDVDGSLWVAAVGGLHHHRNGRWSKIGASQGFPGPGAESVTLDHYGRLWVGNGEELYLFDRRKNRFLPAGVPGGAETIVAGPDGRIWRGLKGKWQVLPLPAHIAPVPLKSWQAPSASSGGMFDRDGNLWALRCPLGICRAAPDRLRGLDRFDIARLQIDRFDQAWQMSSLSTNVVLEDREGNIWIGSQAGLERFRHNKLVAVPLPAGESWFQVVADQDGRAVLGSRPNGFVFEAGASRFDKRYPLVTLSSASDGGLLRADSHGVTHILDGRSRFTALPRGSNGKPVGDYPTLLAGNADSIWLGISGKGMFHLREGKWSPASVYGLPRGVLSISEARDGSVWLGYRDGSIVRFKEGEATTFAPEANGALGAIVFIDAQDDIVLAGEEGLAVLQHGRMQRLRAADPEALSGISGQIVTPEGDRWFNGRKGAVHVTAKAWRQALARPDQPLELRILGSLDGYPGSALTINGLSTTARTRDGRLWFVGGNGVVFLDPARSYRNPVPPALVMAPVDVPGAHRLANGTLVLPAGTTSLRLDYTALSYTMPERLLFRYQMDGVDKGWQDAGNRRSAFYTRLGPGTYRFRLIAFNEDGVRSSHEFSVPITIRPTVVQSRWFLVLCAFAVLSLVLALVHWRTRYMASRFVERFQERLAERERIARALHDSLLQNIQGLILRLHAALKPLPKGSEARANIESILDQADAIMKEAREELLDLRTGPGKGEQDLGHALATFGQSLQEQFGPRFQMLVTGEARTLNVFAWHELYLIGREALFNAYQHARAAHVEIELVYGCDSFSLFIRDDGRGMDESIPCGEGRMRHWGLAGMKERAQGLEGALELWSRQRAGTELVVRVPGRVVYAAAGRPGLRQHLLALLARLPR